MKTFGAALFVAAAVLLAASCQTDSQSAVAQQGPVIEDGWTRIDDEVRFRCDGTVTIYQVHNGYYGWQVSTTVVNGPRCSERI